MGKIKFGKIFAYVLVVALVCAIVGITAFAKGSAQFSIPDKAVVTGESFNVSVTFSYDSEIGTVETNLVYDDSIIQFVSGDGASGGAGILTINQFPKDQNNEVTVNLEFLAVKKGEAELTLSNCSILSPEGASLGSPSAYAYVTVEHGNADSLPVTTTVERDADGVPVQGALKSLTVSVGELTPAFSPDIYDYVVKVDNEVDYFEVDGVTSGEYDHIWYEGAKYLVEGDNISTVTVTDVNGNEKVYKITIKRAMAEPTNSEDEDDNSKQVTKKVTTTTSSAAKKDDKDNSFEDMKKVLIPVLALVMFVLVLALVIIVVWLKKKARERKEEREQKKAEKKRSKIKRKK